MALTTFVPGTLADALKVNENFTTLNKMVAVSNRLFTYADDTQTFTSNGSWTKPTGATLVFVEVWGAGASGACRTSNVYSSGGGGGAYSAQWFVAGSLSAEENVQIGLGGASVTGNADGNPGGSSSFGTHISSGGGNKGLQATTEKPGGFGGRHLNLTLAGTGGSYEGTSNLGPHVRDGVFSGTGGAAYQYGASGGDSLYGGAGGGAVRLVYSGPGGISVYGGNGGAAGSLVASEHGSFPGGGGGGGATASGSGADGQVIVYTII